MRNLAARMLKTAILTATMALLLGAVATSASAREIQVPSKGPGPEQFDSITVQQFGPKEPDRVLVLMPGTAGGAGNFTLVARYLSSRVDGLAVWALDRRSQVLEDTTVFEQALKDEVTPDEAFDHYLGWLTHPGDVPDHFTFLDTKTVPFAKKWGMKVALEDARAVVKRAHDAVGKKGEVFLGGHSLGASLSAAYAAWDFDGRAGYKDVDGIVMIDGGLLGSFDAYDKEQAEEQIASLGEQPFLDLIGVGIPEASGLFAEAGAIFGLKQPDNEASTLQNFPLLPADFKPPVPATNEAAFAYAFDRDTSPAGLALLHVNAGNLSPSGDPRTWIDGGVTYASDLIKGFAQEPANGVEWYFPRRLTIDTNGADQMKQNAVARYLHLRLEHTDEIDIPIYAFQTDLTNGAVLKGAKKLVKRAETTKKQSMLVDGDPDYSHLDPLLAYPGKNKFSRTVIKFLRAN